MLNNLRMMNELQGKLREKLRSSFQRKLAEIKRRIAERMRQAKQRKEVTLETHISLAEFRRKRARQEVVRRARFGLKYYLDRAGLSVDQARVKKSIFNICIGINILLSFYLIYRFGVILHYPVIYVTVVIAVLWLLAFFLMLFVLWLLFHVVLDLRILHRKVTIETVLPDYLQLTSANIRAGIPIDQALWLAVRPRFGILAKEIESVAKHTMTGTELEVALQDFANKYDSVILKRSINLLIEGMRAGGEVGDLLNKIAQNIHEGQLLKKEVAASVTTYIIFIVIAAVVGAPLLFGLSTQLLKTITGIARTVNIPSGVAGISVSFSKAGITEQDFAIFAIVSILITCFFSSMIISIIKRGEAKSGIKYFPVFAIVALILYAVSVKGLGSLFSIFF